MEKRHILVGLFTLLWIASCEGKVNLTQKFTLHADEGCQDEGETYTENVPNLGRVSAIVRTKSLRCACADFGVWSYSEKKNYYGGIFGGSSLAVTRQESSKVCISPDPDDIRSIRKVGAADVRIPALSLYTDFSLRGRELYLDGTFLNLPWAILFRSLGFTGVNATWNLYSDTDMTKDATCIGQGSSTLITFTSGTKLSLVGSVKRSNGGCAAAAKTTDSTVDGTATPTLTLALHDRSKEISTDASELRLPYPITVYSFTFNGASNWTLFRGILLNGRPKCLTYGEGDTGPQTFTDDVGGFPIAGVTVGSIKRGCDFLAGSGSAADEDYPFVDEDIYDYDDMAQISKASRIEFIYVAMLVNAWWIALG